MNGESWQDDAIGLNLHRLVKAGLDDAILTVIGLCGGEVVLSGVRTVSLTVFHFVVGDGS